MESNNFKCIKNQCRYYFASDIYEGCSITDKYRYVLNNYCDLTNIATREEEIACKIARLTNELEYLNKLKKAIAII